MNSPSSGRSAWRWARAVNSSVVTVPWRCGPRPLPQQREERRVADGTAQGVQGERAALVDPVVEHPPHARVGRPAGPGAARRPRCRDRAACACGRLTAGHLRPQPLRVLGEALVQPDVAPVGDGQAVAEPLVRQLVGDQPLEAAPPVDVVGAEDRQPVRLDRHLQLLVDHDDRVLAERVRAEQRSNAAIISGCRPKSCATCGEQPGGHGGPLGHRAGGEVEPARYRPIWTVAR